MVKLLLPLSLFYSILDYTLPDSMVEFPFSSFYTLQSFQKKNPETLNTTRRPSDVYFHILLSHPVTLPVVDKKLLPFFDLFGRYVNEVPALFKKDFKQLRVCVFIAVINKPTFIASMGRIDTCIPREFVQSIVFSIF